MPLPAPDTTTGVGVPVDDVATAVPLLTTGREGVLVATGRNDPTNEPEAVAVARVVGADGAAELAPDP